MGRRFLSPEERAAWAAVTRTVTPLRARPVMPDPPVMEERAVPPRAVKGRVPPPRVSPPQPSPPLPLRPAAVLDGSWEKRIRGGRLEPDISIDLHGMTLAAAHARLDRLLGQARVAGWRVLHIVTGKPRPAPRTRGMIRAEIGDWLAHSPYAGHIASVRQAHPRHGGEGALYVILRRPG